MQKVLPVSHWDRVRNTHKPLVSVLGAKSKPPSARIERWLLQLQQYSYTITHIPGKANRADILSRTPVPDDATTRYVAEDCVLTDDYVYSVALGAIPAALVPSDVEKERFDCLYHF